MITSLSPLALPDRDGVARAGVVRAHAEHAALRRPRQGARRRYVLILYNIIFYFCNLYLYLLGDPTKADRDNDRNRGPELRMDDGVISPEDSDLAQLRSLNEGELSADWYNFQASKNPQCS